MGNSFNKRERNHLSGYSMWFWHNEGKRCSDKVRKNVLRMPSFINIIYCARKESDICSWNRQDDLSIGCCAIFHSSFGFLRKGFSIALKPILGTSSYRSNWPWTHRDPPASASQVLGLKVCATTAQLWCFTLLALLQGPTTLFPSKPQRRLNLRHEWLILVWLVSCQFFLSYPDYLLPLAFYLS